MEASTDILVIRESSMEVPWKKQLKSVDLRGPPRNLHGTIFRGGFRGDLQRPVKPSREVPW